MIFDILTIFPDLLESPLKEGIIRRARLNGQISTNIIDLRAFADGPHAMTDDRPFGGGEGMVMKPEPLAAAVESRKNIGQSSRVILLSPQGRCYNQTVAEELAERSILFWCVDDMKVSMSGFGLNMLMMKFPLVILSSPVVNWRPWW